MNMMKRIVLTLLLMQIVSAADISASDKDDVSSVLDHLHLYASEANSIKYFSLFTNGAIYIGTDADETWNMKHFKDFAHPYFSKGKGWTYTSNNRHIYFSQSKQTAWFDEMLFNESYGETRGTGVLIKSDNGWKISQYHLAFPIPNKVVKQVVKIIKDNKIVKSKK